MLTAPDVRVPARPPAPGADSAGARAQARSWARTTPGWLRLSSVALAVVIAVATLAAVFVTASRQAATNRARTTTAGALIEAETLTTSLSDADRAVAGTFLTSDATTKAALNTRYADDLAQAGSSLAAVSAHTGNEPAAAAPLRTLSTQIPVYAGLIETARTNDRLGHPVGAAYLSEANQLLTATILPAATDIYDLQRTQLAQAYGRARRWPLAVLAGLLLVVLVGGMVWLQRRMSRRFRRTFSLPLVGATVLVVAALVWFAVALAAQGAAIDKAESQGSEPIGVLTEASIAAQQLRADDELTLVTRDTVPAYQQDYATVAGQLERLLRGNAGSGASAQALADARPLVAQLQALHNRIRTADRTNGDLTGAIALDAGGSSTAVPAVADRLDGVLSSGVGRTGTRFSSVASDAADDVAGLAVGLVLLGAVAIALTLLGAQRRIEEYR